jgi:hypothetical protein
LIVAGVFALIVGGLWRGLEMGDSPVINPEAVRTPGRTPAGTPSLLDSGALAAPDDGGLTANAPPEEALEPKISEGSAFGTSPPSQTPDTSNSGQPSNTSVPYLQQPAASVTAPSRPPLKVAQTSPRRLPIPPEWLDAMREESAQCDSFFCHARVQRKYCNGYWNRLPECRKSGNGL